MMLEDLARRGSNSSDARRMMEVIFEQTRMAMCVTDPHQADNPIIAINAAFTRLTGYDEADVLGRNCRFLQTPDTNPTETARIADTIAKREIGYFELLNQRKDGTRFWNALHVGPILSDEGELLFFFGSQWDVTEKVEAIDALHGRVEVTDSRLQEAIDEARRLNQAVDQAKDAMLLTEYGPLDRPGPRIVWANAGFERMAGYSREEIVGQTPRVLQGPQTDRAALDRVSAALKADEAVYDINTVNYKKDGTPFHIEWSITPVEGRDGERRYWLAVQRDVTERVETERQLRMMADELNHRHKNVLALVTAVQNTLPVEGLSAREYREALASRMGALTRAHDAVFLGNAEDASVRDLVERVLEPFPRDRFALGGADVALGSRGALDLAMALHELATNAAKHGALSKVHGRIEIEWWDRDDELWFDWREHAVSQASAPRTMPDDAAPGGPDAPSRGSNAPLDDPNASCDASGASLDHADASPGDSGGGGFGSRLLRAIATGTKRRDAGFDRTPTGLVFRGALLNR